jgi:peptidoglycan/xylan/chitin deacetylase (PgdA/CDA1 family)/Flp pilus assembly protein TadD
VATDVSAIVADFRGVVALVADEAGADDRAVTVARLLFQDSHERLDALAARAAADPAVATALLDQLESDASLHDADKLAFRDLLGELPPSPRALAGRQALDGIQARYDAELTHIFEQLGTRGIPDRREAWEAYLAFVRGQVSRQALIDAHAAELDALAAGSRGGNGLPWRDDKDEVIGRRFPEKTVLLTFDDGPSSKLTPIILKTLERYGAHAVFFEVGRNVEKAAAASRAVLGAGDALANHSFTHAFLPKLADEPLAHQIDDTNQALEAATHQKPVLFRPPYGARNERVLADAVARGMKTVLWNIDAMDWADPVPRSIAARVLSQIAKEKRGIILMHDIHERTTQALPLVLDELTKQGYTFLAWNGHDFVATRGDAKAVAAAPPAAPAAAPLYRESWALVVGINAYKSFPQLSYAVNDAKAVRELIIRKYGFQPDHVTTLLDGDATRDRILAALGDTLADGKRVAREDRVLFFFAGHGVTRKLPSGKSLGYIVPVDATTSAYQSQAISMTNFQDASDSIPAKHVFFVMDACYSGLALTRGAGAAASGDRRQYLAEVTRRTAREVLTAGGADEQVADNGPGGHSIFTWTVLQGLEGKADLDGDGVITATELSAYVAPSVSSLSRQTPVFGHLAGSEGGEFVFLSKPEEEFLSEESHQLDSEAIRLNAELDQIHKQIEEKRARNDKLRSQVAAASAALGSAATTPAAPAARPDAGAAVAVAAAAKPPSGALDAAAESKRQVELGMSLYREKRYDESARAFEAALARQPDNALATNNLGFAYYKLGRLADAVTWYEKTIALDPKRAVAYANLGDAYVDLHRPADAKRTYEKFLELQPHSKIAPRVRQAVAALP